MDLMTAFGAMLSDVTAASASRRQVGGILSWLDLARRAVQLAQALAASRAGLDVAFAGSATHRTWRASSQHILAALSIQADEAARRRTEAGRYAVGEESLADQAAAAAAAARDRAAAACDRAAVARARAGACASHQDAAAFHAQAADADADAAAARAEAARCDAAAAEHRENARKARQLAAELLGWEAAALDAHGTGAAVVAGEEPVARQMGEAIAAAGGLREVPGDKRYLTGEAAAAGRGGQSWQ